MYTPANENSPVQELLATSSLIRDRKVNAMLGGESELHVSKPGEAKRIDIWTESVFYQFFNEFKSVYRQKFKDGLVEIIGDEPASQFLRAVSLWGDGKAKRVKDPLVLGLKRSVMNAVQMKTAEAETLQKRTITPAPAEVSENQEDEADVETTAEEFELSNDEVFAILELNQKLLAESISDCNTWLRKIHAEPIDMNEVLCFRGMTFQEPVFTKERENYEPREFITSFSLSQSAAEQFATMRSPDTGQSVMLCTFLNEISDRMLFFSPFIDMPTLQFEIGVVPFKAPHYCHSIGGENYSNPEGKTLKIDFYVLSYKKKLED